MGISDLCKEYVRFVGLLGALSYPGTSNAEGGKGAVSPTIAFGDSAYLSIWAGVWKDIFSINDKDFNVYFTSNLEAVSDEKKDKKVDFDVEKFSVRPRVKFDLYSNDDGTVIVGPIVKHEMRTDREDTIRGGIFAEITSVKNSYLSLKIYPYDPTFKQFQAIGYFSYSPENFLGGRFSPSLYLQISKDLDKKSGYLYAETSFTVGLDELVESLSGFGQWRFYGDSDGNKDQTPVAGLMYKF